MDLKNMMTELTDDMLEQVAGGEFGDMGTCPVCGRSKREGYICTWCEMDDGVVTCHKCRAKLYKETGCVNCGATWAEYEAIVQRLLGAEV